MGKSYPRFPDKNFWRRPSRSYLVQVIRWFIQWPVSGCSTEQRVLCFYMFRCRYVNMLDALRPLLVDLKVIHPYILRLVFFLLSVSLCSRSVSLSSMAWSSCKERSLSFMICHSSLATSSPTFTNSFPISLGCILSIKKSSPYLLYLMLVLLRPDFLVYFVICNSGSVLFGTSSCSGLFQSSFFFRCHPCSCSRCHHSILRCLSLSPRMLVLPVDTRVLKCGTHRSSGDGTWGFRFS